MVESVKTYLQQTKVSQTTPFRGPKRWRWHLPMTLRPPFTSPNRLVAITSPIISGLVEKSVKPNRKKSSPGFSPVWF